MSARLDRRAALLGALFAALSISACGGFAPLRPPQRNARRVSLGRPWRQIHVCTAHRLAIRDGGRRSVPGGFTVGVRLTNIGGSPCFTEGFAIVELVDSAGTPVADPASPENVDHFGSVGEGSLVVGPRAGVSLRVTLMKPAARAGSGCGIVTDLEVIPPGASTGPLIAVRPERCPAAIVTPLKPGSSPFER